MRRSLARRFAFGLVLTNFVTAGLAAADPEEPGPPLQPFLRIEAEMHTAIIRRMDVDVSGQRLVTASDDKTVRIWDLKTGRLLRILRPPIGDREDGMVYTAAFSPDGSTVAAAGWTGYQWDGSTSIYLFDAKSGEMRGRIRGLPNVINHIAYSKNGTFLAAALGGSDGVRVYRTSDLKLAMQDKTYAGHSYSVEWDAQGRMVTTSYDGHIRLYDADLRLVARRSLEGGKQPSSARFSPDGNLLAVGFSDVPGVAVLDGRDLTLRYAPDVSGIRNGHLASVAWSKDGLRLYAGGKYDDGQGCPLVAWSAAGKGPRTTVAHATNTIMDIGVLDRARVLFVAQDPRWMVVDANGTALLERGPPIVDHRANEEKLRVSSDGARFQFGFDVFRNGHWQRRLAGFDLDARTLALDATPAGESFAPPQTLGLPIADWKNSLRPTLSGRPIELEEHELSRSLAIARDKEHFLLGTEWYLRFFDRAGKEIWKRAIPAVAWGVNLTGDGRWALATFADGTIRWYALADGQERLALFPHPDGRLWIAWTPEGFLAASPGAEVLAGYHLNQGADKAGEFVALDQLADLFYRPDLVSHALAPDAPQKVRVALARVGDVRRVLSSGLPPAVEVAPGEVNEDGEVVLKVRLKDRGGGLGRLVYRVDGVELPGRAEVPGIPGQGPITVRVRLPAGHNLVTVTAYNRKGEIESCPTEIPVEVAAKRLSSTLHLLAAGVTNYRDHSLQLKYASADAQAIATELKKHAKGVFDEVDILDPVLDKDVTHENLKRVFEKLGAQVKPDDAFVFYVAGHGAVRDGRYFFLPADLVYTTDDEFRKNAIDESKLQALFATIPAKKSLILLDTCSAGAFGKQPVLASRGGLDEKAALDRLMKATGRATLTAAADSQMALEGYEGHGVFTAALLRAFASADRKKKLVDTNGDGFVDVGELADFLATEVPRMTREKFNYEQFPQRHMDLEGRAFPIAKSK